MQFHSHTLKNGLQILGETNPHVFSVALGFFVRTGARDETPEVNGVTHFLEHMVFKGTARRTAFDVNRDFDRIGADYNAFTSEENTVFHAAVLPEYLPQAVDILADILRPSLRGDDFDMEKNVILDEIARYEDMPMWCAYDRAKQLFFGEHPLSGNVLGTPESITALTRDQMAEYFTRRYVASNISVVAAGNFDWPEFVRLVEKHCGDWPAGDAPRQNIRETRGCKNFKAVAKDGVVQEHVCILLPGPAANSPLRHAGDTLATILGDDSGSRLYWALIDPGLADSAELSLHEYEGTGSFIGSLSCEPANTAENLQIFQQVLGEVQQQGVTAEELQQAKCKIASRLVRASERPGRRMNAVGMSWTYLRQYRSIDQELEDFDRVSLASIREVLDRYPLEAVTTLAFGPLAEIR